jgi:large subunit ribosomal protein L19e
MNLAGQRRLAAQIMKVGQGRVKFNIERQEEISEALTREDIRALINSGAITKKPKVGVSRGRTRARERQKKKGRGRGAGHRKGTAKARTPKKRAWISLIRAVRDELKKMRANKEITESEYRRLYAQAKGNLFVSRRHLREQVQRMKA